jgi:hypothetical protein
MESGDAPRQQISAQPIQTFTRFINLVPLLVESGHVYEVLPADGAEEPAEFFIEHDRIFYVLFPPVPEAEAIVPSDSLTRRLVDRAFREALAKSGCTFKDGQGGYTAYWPTTHTPTEFRDIFHTYSGFEFRVAFYAQAADSGETQFFLNLDPHTVLVMKASMGDLLRKGMRGADFAGLPARFRPPSAAEDDGVDCNILSVSDDPAAPKCEVLNFQTRTTATVDANHVFIEPKPEVIQDKIISRMNTRFNLNDFVRMKTFVSSRQASRERFEATRKVVGFLSTKGVTPFSIGSTTITINPNFVPVSGSAFPREDEVLEALLLFDKADTSATHLQPYHGLRAYGPFSKDVPDIRLALLGSKPGIALLQQLINDLNQGTSIMPGGMSRFFRTKLVVVEKEAIRDESSDSYVGRRARIVWARRRERHRRRDDTFAGPDRTDIARFTLFRRQTRASRARAGIANDHAFCAQGPAVEARGDRNRAFRESRRNSMGSGGDNRTLRHDRWDFDRGTNLSDKARRR